MCHLTFNHSFPPEFDFSIHFPLFTLLWSTIHLCFFPIHPCDLVYDGLMTEQESTFLQLYQFIWTNLELTISLIRVGHSFDHLFLMYWALFLWAPTWLSQQFFLQSPSLHCPPPIHCWFLVPYSYSFFLPFLCCSGRNLRTASIFFIASYSYSFFPNVVAFLHKMFFFSQNLLSAVYLLPDWHLWLFSTSLVLSRFGQLV